MITFERAQQILACYGGSPEHWPAAERAAMQSLLLKHPELQVLQRQASQLDGRIAELIPSANAAACDPLAAKILASLPERSVSQPETAATFPMRLLDRLNAFFGSPAPAWTLAGASLAILIAIGLVQFGQQPLNSQPQLAYQEDALLLMADALVDNSSDLELLAVLAPELSEDDLDIL